MALVLGIKQNDCFYIDDRYSVHVLEVVAEEAFYVGVAPTAGASDDIQEYYITSLERTEVVPDVFLSSARRCQVGSLARIAIEAPRDIVIERSSIHNEANSESS